MNGGDRRMVLLLLLMAASFAGGLAVQKYGPLSPAPKGELIRSAGPYRYRVGPGVVELRVEIYGTGDRTQCVEIAGEKGENGSGWGRGGNGGHGIFCGEAVAIFPGHGGRASGQDGGSL